MRFGEFIYRLTHLPGVRRVVPKRVRGKAYTLYVHELIRQRANEQRAADIFNTVPTPCDRDSPLKVWMLMGGNDLLMATWALKSLVHQSGRAWDVWFADGGGLGGVAADALSRHFPNARVLLAPELSAAAVEPLAAFPHCRRLRLERDFVLARKLFDPAIHLPASRCLLLDTDVLFFRRPDAILDALSEPPGAANRFSLDADKGIICGGLGVIDTRSVRFATVEAILAEMTPQQRAAWWVEQDVYARMSAVADGLPAEYALAPVPDPDHDRLVTCHYIHTCRHRFYSQGVRRLRREGFPTAPGARAATATGSSNL